MGGIRKEAVADYLALDANEDAVLMGFVIGKVDSAPASGKEEITQRKPLEAVWMTRAC